MSEQFLQTHLITLDVINNKLVFQIKQNVNLNPIKREILNNICSFRFELDQEEFIEHIKDCFNLDNIDILQSTDKNMQFVGKQKRQPYLNIECFTQLQNYFIKTVNVEKNLLILIYQNDRNENGEKVIFGAAINLKTNFQEQREIKIDVPQIYSSSAEHLLFGQYKIWIQKENINLERIDYIQVSFKNFLGQEIQNMVLIITYTLNNVSFMRLDSDICDEVIEKIPFIPLLKHQYEKIHQGYQMYFQQKIFTLISEGKHFCYLSSLTIFQNIYLNTIEFIALPLTFSKKQKIKMSSSDQTIIQNTERSIYSNIIELFQTQNDESQEILIGDQLTTPISRYIIRDPYVICLNQQIGFPFYWYLFHGLAYKEERIKPLDKKFIIYSINNLVFYYDGQIDSKNQKLSLDQICSIYCFNQMQKSEIDYMIQEYNKIEEDKKNHPSNESLEQQTLIGRKRKLYYRFQSYFQDNFSKNNHLIFQGYLKNNLPHGRCYLRSFLDIIYRQDIDLQISIQNQELKGERKLNQECMQQIQEKQYKLTEEDLSKGIENRKIFKISIDGNFYNGILDGEGMVYDEDSQKDKEQYKVYYDHFIDSMFLTDHDKIMNISHYNGEWKKIIYKKDKLQEIYKNTQYLFMYYDSTDQEQSEQGYDLRQFRSLLVKRKVEFEPIINKIQRKIFINIGQGSQNINCCKLFLKTNPNKYGQISVYILYKTNQPIKQISKQFAENIIFAFTENYADNDSQYIKYIDLSLIQNVKSLNIVSHLNSSVSIVNGIGDIFHDLSTNLKDFIFNDMAHLDFSYEQNLFEDYLKQVHNIKKFDCEQQNLSNSGSQGSKNSQSQRERNFTTQNYFSKQQRSITLRGCNLMKINNKFCQTIPLIYLDISGAKVPENFLNNLPIEEYQYLKYLNISYTTLLYDSIQKYFSQKSPNTYLKTFICRGLQVHKSNIFIQSTTSLFENVIKQIILKELEILDISENDKVNDTVIRTIYGYLVQLRTLKVSKCDKLENTSHEYLCKSFENVFTRIHKLDYSRNNISFSPIQPNVKYQSLLSLDITNCNFRDISSFYSYLSIQTELYKIKLDYFLFSYEKFQFLEKICNTCKQLRKIYVFLKPDEKLSLKQLQNFISKGKLIQFIELNIYFFKLSDSNSQEYNHQKLTTSGRNYILNNVSEVNEDRFVNIHLGKFQLVNKQQMQDIELTFNYRKLSKILSFYYFYNQ